MKIETAVEKLGDSLSVKNTLEPKDLALVFCEVEGGEKLLGFFAYVTEIRRDVSKKDEWWFVTFCPTYRVPPKETTWIRGWSADYH